MSQNFMHVRKGLSFESTSLPVNPQEGDVCYLVGTGLVTYKSGLWQPFVVGAVPSGGLQKVRLINRSSTALPSGINATIDGVPVANNDLVLFTALTTGANKIYKVTGVGSSLVWTEQTIFNGASTPTNGDMVFITEGNTWANDIYYFSSSWFSLRAENQAYADNSAITYSIILG